MGLEYLVPLPTLLTSELSVDYDAIMKLVKRITDSVGKTGFIVCDSIVGEQYTTTFDECLNIANKILQTADADVFLSVDFRFLREKLEEVKLGHKHVIVEIDSEIISRYYSLTSIINTVYSKINPLNTLIFLKDLDISEAYENIRETLNLVPELNSIIVNCERVTINDAVLLYGLRKELKREFNVICYGDEGLLLKILVGKPFNVVASPILLISPKIKEIVELGRINLLLDKLSIARKLYRYGKSMPSIIKASLHVIDNVFKPYVRPPLTTEPTYIYDYIKVLLNVLMGS